MAAVKRGEVDAISNADPMINILDREGAVKIVADTRTAEGTQAVYGGPYPAAVLYTKAAFAEKNPNTAQALVTALVRGLKWVQSHSPEEIAKVMPEEYALGNKEIYIQSIKTNLPAYSPDGKFTREARRDRLKVLKAFDPNVQNATIDLSKTYTDTFVDQGEFGELKDLRVPHAVQRLAVHREIAGPHAARAHWRSPGPRASSQAALRPGRQSE